jgi:hypothetical protein
MKLRALSCPAGKGCAAHTARSVDAQEATRQPVIIQDPVLHQWLNPLFQMSSTSPSDYAADVDMASEHASAQMQQQSVLLPSRKEAESDSQQQQMWQHESLQQPARQQPQQQPSWQLPQKHQPHQQSQPQPHQQPQHQLHQQPKPQPQPQQRPDLHHVCDSVSLSPSCACGAHAEGHVVSNWPGAQSLLQFAEDAAREELPGQVCQPEGHSCQVKGQGSCAKRQAHDTEGQMCDLEGHRQAGSPSAPFPMLALDLVSYNAPAEGGSVVIVDPQKAEALPDAQAQKAAAFSHDAYQTAAALSSAHVKQAPALASAQQHQLPIQVHAACANAVSANLQDTQICTAGDRATVSASHSAPASRHSRSQQQVELPEYDHPSSTEGLSPARVLQELPSDQVPKHASMQQEQHMVLPEGHNCVALPSDRSPNRKQSRGRVAGLNGPGHGGCHGTKSVHDTVCAGLKGTLAQPRQWRQRSVAVNSEARDAQRVVSFQSSTVPFGSPAERPRQKLPMPWQSSGEKHCSADRQENDQIQQVVNLLTKGGSLC